MTFEEQTERLLKAAVRAWGPAAQIDVLKEECAELIVAASHFVRNRDYSDQELMEEIGDVELMCQQIRYILEQHFPDRDTNGQIDSYKIQKVHRTMAKIEAQNPDLYKEVFGDES